MTPDPYKANNGGPGDPRDPGSWNKYAYTRGDPANRIDPSGTCDENITYIAPDGTIVIDCIDFPAGGGAGVTGVGGSPGTQPSSNPCQSLMSGGLYDAYEVCMAGVQQSLGTCPSGQVLLANGQCADYQQELNCQEAINGELALKALSPIISVLSIF